MGELPGAPMSEEPVTNEKSTAPTSPTLQELSQRLEGKSVGTVEFTAFSDCVDFNEALFNLREARKRKDESELRVAEQEYVLTNQRIKTEQSRTPGYYQAYTTFSDLSNQLLAENLEGDKPAANLFIDHNKALKELRSSLYNREPRQSELP